jgi:glycosyltransferase involved in cell wall biosynthesis
VRVGLDATPLLGPRTGVGRYVEGLAGALAGAAGPEPEEVALIPFSWRGTGQLASVAPAGPRVRCGRRRVPARLLQAAWARLPWPPVEWLAGPVDVFHATNFVGPPARRAAVVVTIHDLTYLRRPEMVTDASARYRDLVPRALARGAMVCTPTAAVAAEVADEYGLPPERLAVTPLGVGQAWRRAAPPDPSWLAANGLPERYLLFVGSREPRKNLPTLLSAYRELLAAGGAGGGGPGGVDSRSHPPRRWATVPLRGGAHPGGAVSRARAPEGPASEDLAAEGLAPEDRAPRPPAEAVPAGEGVPPLVLVGPPGWGEAVDTAGLPAEAVRSVGYLQQQDLVRVVTGAAVLVFPSWYEGFGLPALEALACGTPVVAADLPALREVLGDQAELVAPGDATALAGALTRVLDDPGGEPARAARRARAAGFTWENCAQATLSAYRLALEAR